MKKTALKTALYEEHLKQGGLMVDFAGWEMPLHYGSQLNEHLCVRERVGMFDVSHMGIIDMLGTGTADFLRYVLANNIDKLKDPGSALYTCMLNEAGGIIDDLIVYYLSPGHYRLVVNAATTEKDLVWLQQHAKRHADVSVSLLKNTSILAVQGPLSLQTMLEIFPNLAKELSQLRPFHFIVQNDILIARTGYTGELGYEILCNAKEAVMLWQSFRARHVQPIGLGARDTLRLEAGYCLYGQDMDEGFSPWVSNLMWTVALEPKSRDFIGRRALLEQKEKGIDNKLIGIHLLDKGVLRHNQTIFVNDTKVGKITSGSFSPSLKRSIGLARVNSELNNGCLVEIRGKLLKAELIKPPFIRSNTR